MNEEPENKKELIKHHSEKLAKLGMKLSDIKFSYKVEEKSSKKYWEARIIDFQKYSEAGMEYYNEVFSMMKLINKEESQAFLLYISKFHQLGSNLVEILEKIKENPSIMNSKDKQQSQWSKEIKNDVKEQSNKCLQHEKEMNSSFREFYESNQDKITQ